MDENITVSYSPYIRHCDTTRGIMADVLIALCPAAIFGCVLFGLHTIFTLLVTIATAVLSEWLWNLIFKKPNTIGDLSAAVTGMLLGLSLSPRTPFWVGVIGSVVAIVVKQLFGGLGLNLVNPSITSRIVLAIFLPSFMTRYIEPISHTVTSATPFTDQSSYTFKQLFLGMHSGAIGETSAFLLIVGGIYLVMRRIITPVIPLCFVGTVAIMALVFGENVSIYIFGGGLMLGAIFMATDYVTSPVSFKGKIIFGVGCGLIYFVIRKFIPITEGVPYAILIMNILVPYINKFTLRKPFGMENKAIVLKKLLKLR